ncbi:MAG: ankyrin repeat domain-containing protein [Treponema sp.]|nr:ankyrin repeat domain-containing protein [Treponema sp.]
MKKRIFLILTFAVLFFYGCATTKTETEHPATYNIDLGKYTNILDLKADSGKDNFSGIIKGIKFKKSIPEAGDKIVIYCTGKPSIEMQSLKGEIFTSNQSYGTFELINQEDKKNAFSSKAEIILDKQIEDSVSVRLFYENAELTKNPWIQMKASKLPKPEKPAPAETAAEAPAKKADEKLTEKQTVSETEKTTEPEKTVEPKKTKKTTKKSGTSTKKLKSGDLPSEIEDAIKNTEQTTESWYICKVKSKKKAGKLLSGPFSTKEQAILVWIYKDLPENKKYCIAKNFSFITSTPSSFFTEQYKQIKSETETLDSKAMFNKYFHLGEEEEIQPEKTEPIVEPEQSDSFFDLSKYETTEDLYSTYQKEYLQDYAPKKELRLPEEIITEKTILNPDEADNFGCTLLMKAAKNGNNWELKSLLSSGADVNLTDRDGWTALMYACRYQENVSIVDSLIEAGAQVKIKNKYDLSPLILAATYNGNPEIIKKLLNYYAVSEKEVLQAFVLLLTDNSSSDFSKIAKIETFIDKSIPLNTFYNGKTPLMYAAQFCNSTNIIDVLLRKGAVTSIRSTEGKTAFDYAMENNKLKHDDIFWSLNKK